MASITIKNVSIFLSVMAHAGFESSCSHVEFTIEGHDVSFHREDDKEHFNFVTNINGYTHTVCTVEKDEYFVLSTIENLAALSVADFIYNREMDELPPEEYGEKNVCESNLTEKEANVTIKNVGSFLFAMASLGFEYPCSRIEFTLEGHDIAFYREDGENNLRFVTSINGYAQSVCTVRRDEFFIIGTIAELSAQSVEGFVYYRKVDEFAPEE